QTHFRGQWGLAQDNFGRLYYNHNSHYLYADYFPDHYLTRNSSWRARHGINANIVNSNKAFPIRINPGVNRGYIDGQLREDGRLNTVTAISDALIYRGDQFGPEYVGDAFIPEPGANTIAHFRMQEEGVELKAEHITYEDPDWEKRDFLASTDERFRPIGIYNAPDGSIYVLDLYRGILQHKVYVTTYLRNYILEQGLDKPVGLGRIYRIVREEKPTRQQPPALEQATTAELVQYLSHDNGWHRDTAQRLLVQRQDEEAARPLRSLAQNGRAPLGRLHALWTLEGLDQLDTATVNAALRDPDPQVRIAAMRTAATLFEAEEPPAGLQRMLPRVIALTEDNDQAVRVQAAFTLGHFLGEDAKAERAMAEALTREPNDRYIRQAVITGVGGHEYAILEGLLDDAEWAEPRSGRGAVLSELSATIFQAGRAAEVAMLIERAQAEEGWRRRELLQGMARAAGDRRSPVDLPAQPTSLQTLAESDDEATRTAAQRIADKLNWPDAEMAAAEVVAELSEADEALRQRGQTMYMALCMACHQLHGQGQVGMAPSLVDSQYVLGPPEKLVRIALDGVTGVTEGDQKWNQAMPGMRHNPA
ncbi:MAG: HEAT repeat domain-containing protein, partial [Phycisphaeraceae bacterium]